MKVLHVLYELRYSGAELMYINSASLFQDLGCELSVVATSESLGENASGFYDAGYKVYHMPCPNIRKYFSRIKFYFNFIKFLKVNKIEVVHIHPNWAMWGISLCSYIANVKCIYSFHNVFECGRLQYFYRYLLRWSAKKIFKCKFHSISNSVYNHELEYFNNKTNLIFNWYNENKFFSSNSLEKLQIRNELGIQEDAIVIISVGWCNHVKRHDDIIKSVDLIRNRISNFRYIHLGSGELECFEKHLSTELELDDYILFLGNKDDVRRYLVAADIYVMTSKYEGISLSTIEAMACGIPTILYDVPGLKDFNLDGTNTILIDENYELLAKEVLQLHQDNDKRQLLIHNSREFILNNYNMRLNVNKIFNLYNC